MRFVYPVSVSAVVSAFPDIFRHEDGKVFVDLKDFSFSFRFDSSYVLYDPVGVAGVVFARDKKRFVFVVFYSIDKGGEVDQGVLVMVNFVTVYYERRAVAHYIEKVKGIVDRVRSLLDI